MRERERTGTSSSGYCTELVNSFCRPTSWEKKRRLCKSLRREGLTKQERGRSRGQRGEILILLSIGLYPFGDWQQAIPPVVYTLSNQPIKTCALTPFCLNVELQRPYLTLESCDCTKRERKDPPLTTGHHLSQNTISPHFGYTH